VRKGSSGEEEKEEEKEKEGGGGGEPEVGRRRWFLSFCYICNLLFLLYCRCFFVFAWDPSTSVAFCVKAIPKVAYPPTFQALPVLCPTALPTFAAMTSPTCSLTDVSLPYGQRGRQFISDLDGPLLMAPNSYMSKTRDDDWGQDTTTREWPPGSTVLLSRKNMFYTAPPNGDGIKVAQSARDINVRRVVIVESKFIPDFRTSRWISVSFHCRGLTIWTNVVREPLSLRSYQRPTHYTNKHTQWGYRFTFPPEGLASGASFVVPADGTEEKAKV
jgi:hypothetical protein